MPGKRPAALEGTPEMSDAEVLAVFMEPDAPENGGRPGVDVLKKFSPSGWWRYSMLSCNWKQPILVVAESLGRRLDLLHEVESRLTDEQRLDYREFLVAPHRESGERGLPLVMLYWVLLHATAEQKIAALAKVLRPIVGGKK